MTTRTVYVAPEILEASLRAAPHGQGFIYAAGPALDPAHPTAAVARSWAERGKALTNISGRDLQGRLQYRITRFVQATGPTPNPSPEGEGDFGPARHGLADGDAELFELLAERAAAGLACPSDAELAGMLHLQDRHAASYRLHRLVKLGVIAISNPEPRKRVVTILSRRPAAEAAQDDRKGK